MFHLITVSGEIDNLFYVMENYFICEYLGMCIARISSSPIYLCDIIE